MSAKKSSPQAKYAFDANGGFVLENYNQSKPFSNFFPGIAGIWGIPMWVFYVNRGQCITSFGIEGKDKAILEFQSANKAYRLTSMQGFRTFIKVTSKRKTSFWEPFCSTDQQRFQTQQKMLITSHDLKIEDVNDALGLKVEVNYFTVPNESFPALVRRVTFTNISKKRNHLDIELIDGLPVIMPFGLKDWATKTMSRTAEAWIKVENIKNNAPYFHLNVEVSDTPDINYIHSGNFYFSFDPSRPYKSKTPKGKLLDCIVNASSIFGHSLDFICPEAFLQDKNFYVPSRQQTSNRTPCAMSFTKFRLSSGNQPKEIVSMIGYAHDQRQLNGLVHRVLQSKDFINQKARQNQEVVDQVKNFVFTNSNDSRFNQYCQQTFLDNVLRGGMPVSLKTKDGDVAFYVFSRKHGDPERDYNYFVLAPTHFSQGKGNYRDVNQNRRNDVWFNQDVKDSSIIDLLNISQADGYNPLVIKGMSFSFESFDHVKNKITGEEDYQKVMTIIKDCCTKDEHAKILEAHHKKMFYPGELLEYIMRKGIALKVSNREFLDRVLKLCHKQVLVEHAEGFWTDHWTYNLDLIESYLSVYPEELQSLLLEKKVFSFYHNTHYVLPRNNRYLMTYKGIRQYHSVRQDASRAGQCWDRLRSNDDTPYYTTLTAKILCIIANKAATFDPSGIGIEMEADKPNWYDALNGLPGLLGSSLSETLELKRLCVFLLNSFEQLRLQKTEKIYVFEELEGFILELKNCLEQEKDPLRYWDQSNNTKEYYRECIRKGHIGKDKALTIDIVKSFLELIISKIEWAVSNLEKDQLLPTYFYHEVLESNGIPVNSDEDTINKLSTQEINPASLKFKRHNLPLFLEGFVHALRVEKDVVCARKLYKELRKSRLFDKKLQMYKVNENLSKESGEIGRAHTFPAGWLENESIWLHMEYKYLLELLRCELFEEYYETFRKVLIPFMDAQTYGRSTLENSSFIVSSAHEDQALHGQGFVARLSGSTAEFIHMWLLMNVGKNPFTVSKKGELIFTLKPVLAGWLFTTKKSSVTFLDRAHKRKRSELPKNSYAFNLFGAILVVYHNPRRCNIFGVNNSVVKEIRLTYPGNKKPIIFSTRSISGSYANDIRDRKVERIDVFFK